MISQVDTKEGRKWLLEMLQTDELTVFFTKKDGTERQMLCTLAENKIPNEKMPTAENQNLMMRYQFLM